jgi:hypothetical protein
MNSTVASILVKREGRMKSDGHEHKQERDV